MNYNVSKGKIKNYYHLSLKKDEFLSEALTGFCKKKKIKNGFISVIGALQNVNLGYYHQKTKKYSTIKINKPVEIATASGNVSLKEGNIFLHLHIGASDEKGNMLGGHLMPESRVFAAEAFLLSLKGAPKKRQLDPVTGLFLWKKK